MHSLFNDDPSAAHSFFGSSVPLCSCWEQLGAYTGLRILSPPPSTGTEWHNLPELRDLSKVLAENGGTRERIHGDSPNETHRITPT